MKRLFFFVWLTLIITSLFAQNKQEVTFSEKEKMIINTESQNLLINYQLLINQLGNTLSTETDKVKSITEGIIKLFINRNVLVYNDLDPDHRMSEYYEIEAYASNMGLWYPDGISVSLDFENSLVSSIKKHSNILYTIDLITQKDINGNFMNRKQNNNSERLSFRVAFSKEKGRFKNFKLVGVRNFNKSIAVDDTKLMEEVNNANLPKEDVNVIQAEVKNSLNDYIRNLSLIGNPNEPEDEKVFYRPAFLELFSDSTSNLYNDLEPSPTETTLPAYQYINKFRELYPKGINNIFMNIDSVKFGPPLKTGDGFYMYAYGAKNFSGKVNNKSLHRISQNMVFKIVFTKQGTIFGNYKIGNIENATLNFYQAAGSANKDTTLNIIKPARRNGLIYGVSLKGALSPVFSNNIKSLSLDKNYQQWSVSDKMKFAFAIDAIFFKTNILAIASGLEYAEYSSTFSLNDSLIENSVSVDLNGDNFNKIIKASNYDSLLNFKTISIPLKIVWISGSVKKIGLYAEAGAKFSFFMKKEYTATGNIDYKGYYPINPEPLKVLDFKELLFYSRQNIPSFGSVNVQSFAISATISAGVNIPLNYFTSIRIGPEVNFGLTDIDKTKTFTDIFGNNLQKQKTVLRSYGIKIMINYKL